MKKYIPILLSCFLAGCFVCKKTAPAAETAPAEIIVQSVNEETRQPEVKEVLTFKASKHAQFEHNSAVLTEEGKNNLGDIAEELRKYPNASFTVAGHTCNVGEESYNLALSQKRANAVAQTLKERYGITNTIAVLGKGHLEPKESNDTVQGRRANRRAEIHITDDTNDATAAAPAVK
jgi:OOP family OmpA-OmpF porin